MDGIYFVTIKYMIEFWGKYQQRGNSNWQHLNTELLFYF